MDGRTDPHQRGRPRFSLTAAWDIIGLAGGRAKSTRKSRRSGSTAKREREKNKRIFRAILIISDFFRRHGLLSSIDGGGIFESLTLKTQVDGSPTVGYSVARPTKNGDDDSLAGPLVFH